MKIEKTQDGGVKVNIWWLDILSFTGFIAAIFSFVHGKGQGKAA